MKENENIDELLKSEENYRKSKDKKECLDCCLKILNKIKSSNNNYKFEIISKLFLHTDQSNYVRIYLMHALFQDNNFINTTSLKRKYYQLLIDSFKNEAEKDLLKQKKDIIELFDKSNLDNFDDLDKYIVAIVSDLPSFSTNDEQKNEAENNLINDSRKSKRFSETLLPTSLSSSEKMIDPDNSFPQSTTIQTSFEDINTNRQSENISMKNMLINSEQKKSEMKKLLKMYKANSLLPLIIMSVSANLNKYQFLELIKNTFIKFNYKLICNIKDTDFENLNIFEYRPKNCCEKMKYLLKNKYVKNEFQVLAILKSDENNFTKGINTFLNDVNERKIAIKSIKGNEKSIIQFIINFLSIFCLSINKVKITKQSKCLLKYNIEESIQKIIRNKKNAIYKSVNLPKGTYGWQSQSYIKLIEDETYVEKTNSQAKKFYELYKILSKGDYELGKSIKLFIENFKKTYQSLSINEINTLDTKKIMAEIIKILELCTNTLNSTYNNYQNNDDIAYFSLASEQFIFNKIYYIIYDIYDKKYSNLNNNFISIQKDINDKLDINELFQKIGVKKKLRGTGEIPYKSVIDIINMVPLEKSLKKKFEILTQSSLEIRTNILEYSNGKYELDSMDDELPIVIYITSQVKVPNLFAELYIVDEYIKSILRDEFIQNKMVTNLISSMMFICNNWNNDTLSFDKNN